MPDLLLLGGLSALVFALAALAQAVTGFGSALVAVPALAVLIDPVPAVVAATAVSLVLTVGAARAEREHVDTAAARVLVLTGLLGMPAGLAVLTVVDAQDLETGIAAALLVMVVLVVAGLRIGARGLPVAGVMSGALLTSTGMNGPPLVLALMDREPRRYRATLQAVFAAQDLVAVAAFAVLGHVDVQVAVLVAGGVVGLPLGWRIGELAFRRISAERLRPVVICGLLVTATTMLVGSLV